MSARTILHVGCGNGGLAAAYRPMNPRARLLGLALDESATGAAAPYFDQIEVLKPGEPVPAFGGAQSIDCIIYDEVLEALEDPWSVIRQHAELLTASGMMLIRARNSNHWRLAEALLVGSAARGALQSLPGLDGETTRRQLEDAGLFVCDVSNEEAEPEAANAFVEALDPALRGLDVDPADFRARCMGSHLIWRVRKAPVDRIIVSGSMLIPVGGVSHVRVLHPLHALSSDPCVTTTVTDQIELASAADTPRLFVLHRPALMGDRGKRIVTALSEAGYVIVTEFDDHPDHFDMMQTGGELTFTGVHAVQTSTPALARELERYNQEVTIFPNAVVTLPEVSNFTDPDSLTVFFGALNREKDWQPLMPIINEVADLAGPRLKFQVVHDKNFFAALETPHKSFTPTCDYDTYRRLLGRSEISFMPLADTPFNRAKSDLKFIEAASFRVAALASAVVYENTIVDGQNGVIFRDPAQLRLALMRLVALPGLTRRLADEARAYVARERMMAYQVDERIAWYRSLWDRRHELEHARKMRLARYAGLAA